MEWCDYEMSGVICDGNCCEECRHKWQFWHTIPKFKEIVKEDFAD